MKKINKILLTLVMPLVVSLNALGQTNQTQAFAAAQSDSSTSNLEAIFGMVSVLTGSNVVRNYSSTPPAQASYWQGTNSTLSTLISGGSAQVNSCQTANMSGASAEDKEHCEAVNAIAQQPANRPANMITQNDPLIVQGKAVSANPEAIAGTMVANYSACTNNTVTTNAPTVIQTCYEYGSTESSSCSTQTQITLQSDTFYKCLESINTQANSVCTYGRTLVLNKDTNYQCQTIKSAATDIDCNKTATPKVSISGFNKTAGTSLGTVSVDAGDIVSNFVSWDTTATATAYADGAGGIQVVTKITSVSTPFYNADPMQSWTRTIAVGSGWQLIAPWFQNMSHFYSLNIWIDAYTAQVMARNSIYVKLTGTIAEPILNIWVHYTYCCSIGDRDYHNQVPLLPAQVMSISYSLQRDSTCGPLESRL